MIRMTLALGIAIYAGLAIWGDPVTEAVASTGTDAAVALALAPSADPDRPVILSSTPSAGPAVTRAATTRTVVPDAASIAAASSGLGEPTLVSLMPGRDAAVDRAPAAETGPAGPRLRVNGDAVNMRAGPSTADPVVASLTAGTLAEPIGDVQAGWIEIRTVETGETGFMAARFLDPA